MTNIEDCFFKPTASSGRALRSIFNAEFANSLDYVLTACAEHIDFDAECAKKLLARIRSGSRETPYLYSLFFKIVDAIQADDIAIAGNLIARIIDQGPAENGVTITSLDSLSEGWSAEVLASYFSEEDALFRYVGPEPASAAQARSNLNAALEILRWFAPELADEMEELVSTIILAKGIQIAGDEAAEFESASALRAFGAVLFNSEASASALQCAVSLIHEHAHIVLFAYSPNEGVVTNPPDELHISPLRPDARPVEGIFHQSFVLARMIYGMDLLRKSDGAPQEYRSFANTFVDQNVKRFHDAAKTLDRYASFTAQGAKAMRASQAFVASLS